MKMLNMQLLRDLRSQWSRYLASALLILLGIVVSAGMAAGNGSALNTAKDAQDTGNVEDGYLELTAELTNDQLTSLRNKGLTFERAEFTDVPAADNSTVRVYENRSTIDRINLESGSLPTANDEIALEQTYARAHNLKVGDTLPRRHQTHHHRYRLHPGLRDRRRPPHRHGCRSQRVRNRLHRREHRGVPR